MRAKLLGTAFAGVIVGGLLNSPAVRAVAGVGDVVTDPGLYEVMAAMQSVLNTAVGKVAENVMDLNRVFRMDIGAMTQQVTNYLKGSVASQVQIADASNTAMARYRRDERNADIVANHVVGPLACEALDGGQAVTVSAGQRGQIAGILGTVSDARGEGALGTPAYYGAAQAAQANRDVHLARYCSAEDVEAGLCRTASPRANANQRARSLFRGRTYADQSEINAANDYVQVLLQPNPPPPLRGDERKALVGSQYEQSRKNYNATMSMAFEGMNQLIAANAEGVVLSDAQRQQMRSMGMQPTSAASWWSMVDLEVKRRFGNQNWAIELERMQSTPVLLRELIRITAFQTHLTWTQMQREEVRQGMEAATLAARAEENFSKAKLPTMPTPVFGVRN